MHKFRFGFIPAFIVGFSLLSFAGGCGGGPAQQSEEVKKQNFDDENKAMKNAQKPPGKGF
jgi:hypothetical protein